MAKEIVVQQDLRNLPKDLLHQHVVVLLLGIRQVPEVAAHLDNLRVLVAPVHRIEVRTVAQEAIVDLVIQEVRVEAPVVLALVDLQVGAHVARDLQDRRDSRCVTPYS